MVRHAISGYNTDNASNEMFVTPSRNEVVISPCFDFKHSTIVHFICRILIWSSSLLTRFTLSIFITSSSLCLVVVVVVDLLCSPVMEKCKTDHCVSQQSHFRTQTKTSTLTLFPCRGSRGSLVETLTSFGIAFQLASFTTFVVIVVLVVHLLAYAFQHKSFHWLQPPALALFARLCFVLFFVKQWCV